MPIVLIFKTAKMKKTLFLIFALLLVTVVKAQEFRDFYTVEKDGSVELDITNYNLDERFYTIYSIYKDNKFGISEGNAYGLFRITFKEDIDIVLERLHSNFNELSKYDIAELFEMAKTTLPQNMQDFKPAPLTLQEALSED